MSNARDPYAPDAAGRDIDHASIDGTPIELSMSGGVSDRQRRHAIDKIAGALSHTGARVLHLRIRLERNHDSSGDRHSHALVSADLDGEVVRAHVAASTLDEAIDLLDARLRHRLEHLAAHRRALRKRGTTSPDGTWRHGDQPTHRPPYYPRSVDDREIVRHKTFTSGPQSVDEAVFDLEAFDYDFFLFTDAACDQDAVVERRPGGGYALRYLDPAGAPNDAPPSVAAIETLDLAAPRLTLEQAKEHLDVGHEPWVFHLDLDAGRGHVLYRRYDGHYGLIMPADETT